MAWRVVHAEQSLEEIRITPRWTCAPVARRPAENILNTCDALLRSSIILKIVYGSPNFRIFKINTNSSNHPVYIINRRTNRYNLFYRVFISRDLLARWSNTVQGGKNWCKRYYRFPVYIIKIMYYMFVVVDIFEYRMLFSIKWGNYSLLKSLIFL